MVFLEMSPPINNLDIALIEEKLKITFPSDFVLHYLQYNGGYPDADVYRLSDGEKITLNTFYALKYEGFGNIEDVYINLVITEEYLPLGIIIFATDDGGNFFCVSAREKDYGKIYYFNNDHYSTVDPEAALILLENTFNDFIANLS